MSKPGWLGDKRSHATACHRRWIEARNRKQEAEDYREEWYQEQCGRCRYFLPLEGALRDNYGVCSNAASEFDGWVRFEHDGCDQFSDAGDWWTAAVRPSRRRADRGRRSRRRVSIRRD